MRLASEGRCFGLTPRERFRRIRKCTAPPYVRATGRDRWRVSIGRKLRPGRYVLYARATDNLGLPEGGFGAQNRVAFRVRR